MRVFAVIFAHSGIILNVLVSLKLNLKPSLNQTPPGNVYLVKENYVSPVIWVPTTNPSQLVVCVETCIIMSVSVYPNIHLRTTGYVVPVAQIHFLSTMLIIKIWWRCPTITINFHLKICLQWPLTCLARAQFVWRGYLSQIKEFPVMVVAPKYMSSAAR